MFPFKMAALALTSFAFGAMAQATPGSNPRAPDATKSKVDQMVCKSELRTGTRFKERTCMTVKEWEAMREEHRRGAQQLADQPTGRGIMCSADGLHGSQTC